MSETRQMGTNTARWPIDGENDMWQNRAVSPRLGSPAAQSLVSEDNMVYAPRDIPPQEQAVQTQTGDVKYQSSTLRRVPVPAESPYSGKTQMPV